MASEAGMPPYELGGGLSAWHCGRTEGDAGGGGWEKRRGRGLKMILLC